MALPAALDLKRSGGHILRSPAGSDAFVDDSLWEANARSPIGRTHGGALVGKWLVPTHVSGLLASRRPSAVALAVASAVVFAIKTRALRRVPHVIKKVGEHQPFIAHTNSAPTVIGELRVCVVATPSDHVAPGCIDACLAHSMDDAMLDGTPARFACASGKGGCLDITQRAAFAAARIHAMFLRIQRQALQHRPFADCLAC